MRMNSIIKVDEYARRKGEGSASYLESDAQYYAIVYEYVPEAQLECDSVQS